MTRIPARIAMMTGLGAVLALSAVPAQAQDESARVKQLEAEVRALQRKVFGTTDSKYFTPEITPPATTATPAPAPVTTPVTDLLQRMDSLEGQMQRLTAQVEQNSNRLTQLEARLPAAAAAVPTAVGPVDAAGPAAPTATPPSAAVAAPQSNLDAMTGGASGVRAPVAAGPSAARVAAIEAIVKPQTDDPGDDEYSYGFRLYDAKFYPEAEQQLKLMLEKYPKHRRASWARNLIGRAYLEEGNPLEAAKWFVQNYQTDKRGERAPDSLLYLAVAMKQVKDNRRACIALAEFSTTYAAEAAGRLKSVYDDTRRGLDCSA